MNAPFLYQLRRYADRNNIINSIDVYHGYLVTDIIDQTFCTTTIHLLCQLTIIKYILLHYNELCIVIPDKILFIYKVQLMLFVFAPLLLSCKTLAPALTRRQDGSVAKF